MTSTPKPTPTPTPTHKRVVVVTGASRGAGKGIAIALASPETVVYVTGRSVTEGDAPLPGTVGATAAAVCAAGGQGIAVACDHADDAQVARLFEQVRDEQHGCLDILVNNACALPAELTQRGPFWTKPLHMQQVLDVGLRSSYVASWHAAKMMAERRQGLIVQTSSYGSVCYMHGPAYGAGKAAVDKMVYDMAVDLRPFDVTVVSLWMGLLDTERTAWVMNDPQQAGKYASLKDAMESPQFTGRVIDALWHDPDRLERSGKVWIGAELAHEYGLSDVNGRRPPSFRAALGEPPRYSPTIVE